MAIVKSPDNDSMSQSKAVQLISRLNQLVCRVSQESLTEVEAQFSQQTMTALCGLAKNTSAKALISKTMSKLSISVLRVFREFPTTLQSACDLIWALAYHDQSVQAMFAESSICAFVIETVVNNFECLSLIKSAFGAISSLCRHPLNQNVARKAHAIEVLLKVLANNGYGDEMLLQYTLDASASITHGHRDNGNVFIQQGGVQATLFAMEKNSRNPAIVRSASVLLVVVRDRPLGSQAIVSAGAMDILLDAIAVHTTVPELEHVLCALVGQLCRDVPQGARQVAEQGGVKAVIPVLENHSSQRLTVEACYSILASCCSQNTPTSKQDFLDVSWSAFRACKFQLNSFKLLTDICSVVGSKGMNKLVVDNLVGGVFELPIHLEISEMTSFYNVLEKFMNSDIFKSLVAITDAWMECSFQQTEEIETILSISKVVYLVNHDIEQFLGWQRCKCITITSFLNTAKGSLKRLHALDRVRRDGRHYTDIDVALEVGSFYSILSASLWCRERMSTKEVLSLQQDCSITELLSVALLWLDAFKLLKFECNDTDEPRWKMLNSLCRFLVVSLYAERQLTLRCLAGSSGVSLVLALQKKLQAVEQDVYIELLQSLRSKTALILKLIGGTCSSSFPDSINESDIVKSFYKVSSEIRNAQVQRKLEKELRIVESTKEPEKADICIEEKLEESYLLSNNEIDASDNSDADGSETDEPPVEESSFPQTATPKQECQSFTFEEPTSAMARFVATLPELIHDASVDDLEPYIPEYERPRHAVNVCGDKRLVYDWRLALGEGEGRAKSTLSPALPYILGAEPPLQKGTPSSFLVGGCKTDISPTCETDHHLLFESRFEGANLLQAVRLNPNEYDLVIRSDLHTTGHHQWFYFAVTNTHPMGHQGTATHKFNIVNHCKPGSMFAEGAQPCLYSFSQAETQGRGWRRAGSKLSYGPNDYTSPGEKKSVNYYSLTFSMTFDTPNDVYLVAMCFPYSYTKLQNFLDASCSEATATICERRLLCKSLGGLRCDELTITNFKSGSPLTRPAVVFTGRVHPGETNASYMMEGTIRFLLGNSALAKMLRELYVFKIVPMLNPDGVYHGNYRTSLSGCDLNRTWMKPSPHDHPTIWHTKSMIRQTHSVNKVSLFVDFHGHSRKKNIFMYGVEYRKTTLDQKTVVRTFPKLVAESQFTSHLFSLPDCSFSVSKSHLQAARIVVARELGIRASFTLEASFAGAGVGSLNSKLHNSQFNAAHFQEIGNGLCEGLLKMNHFELHDSLERQVQNIVTDTISNAALDFLLGRSKAKKSIPRALPQPETELTKSRVPKTSTALSKPIHFELGTQVNCSPKKSSERPSTVNPESLPWGKDHFSKETLETAKLINLIASITSVYAIHPLANRRCDIRWYSAL